MKANKSIRTMREVVRDSGLEPETKKHVLALITQAKHEHDTGNVVGLFTVVGKIARVLQYERHEK